MSYKGLLDCTCTLQRVRIKTDEYGTPDPTTPETLTEVGVFPCAVSRQTISSAQGAPMVQSGVSYRLYFLKTAPIQEGDLAIVPPHGKFRLAAPYRPRNHHIEVDGSWEGEA